MSSRKSISNKLRFQILDRDRYTCQYCGATAPDAKLQIDHIVAVKNGGTNDEDNLVTACFECNSGKSARRIQPRPSDQQIDARVAQYYSRIVDNLTARSIELRADEVEDIEWFLLEIVSKEHPGCKALEWFSQRCTDFDGLRQLGSLIVDESMHEHFDDGARS